MREPKLTRDEREIENTLLKGEYIDVGPQEFKNVANIIKSRKKDAVLNIRVNSGDLKIIKKKAEKFGIGYQTFISELIHRVAHN
jgi:predicted DNA binding CopG/RHH family protein